MSFSLPAWRADAARIAELAWPVFVGQISVLLFSTVDTLLLARHSAADLAAFSVGAAVNVSVFIGMMGAVMALSPIVGQLQGAQRHEAAGAQVHQALWVALGFSLLGSTLLFFPAPFLALAQATPEMAAKVRGFLSALALALPASLLFTIYRGFNNAISRPKAVMKLQVLGLAVKLPLSTLLVFGAGPVPSLGATGCGIATCVAMWAQALLAYRVLRRDPFYAPYRLFGRGLQPPQREPIAALLRLGVPMGLMVMLEVTGFAFMAFFIVRMSTQAAAGHQIAANLVSMVFMVSLALAQGTSTLVAQRIGAGELAAARRMGWHGMALTSLAALAVGSAVFAARGPILGLYTADAAIVAAAMPLLAWVVLFHLFDAQQIMGAFVLRAWRVAALPVLVYAVSLWGIGLGGGYLLGFDPLGIVPPALRGAPGYWAASTTGLGAAALGLALLMRWVARRSIAERGATPPAPAG